MILYNVTIKIDSSIDVSWVEWMKEEHMPEMIGTGCFTHFQLLRLIEIDDSEGPTYAAQYFANSKAFYNQYIEKFSAAQHQKEFDKWGSLSVAFRTVMQVVN